MEVEEDPFGVFGLEEDENSNIDDDNQEDVVDDSAKQKELSRIAQSLVERANRERPQGGGESNDSSDSLLQQQQQGNGKRSTTTANNETPSSLESYMRRMVQMPWKPPLYLHSDVALVAFNDVGGGRGYVARRDLAPGTLLLVEEPLVLWPNNHQSIDLDSVRYILLRDNAENILRAMEAFHPSKAVVDAAAAEEEDEEESASSSSREQVEKMLNHYRYQYGDKVIDGEALSPLQSLVDQAASLGLLNSDGSPLSDLDVLRLLVALRYNSLQSGVYLHVAMLNHADAFNCVKFLPEQSYSAASSYSEVRTTRPISAGEALTISYLPRIQSHASRRRYLWEQHRFDIGAKLSPTGTRLEVIGKNRLPPSSLLHVDTEDSVTSRIETATAEFEEHCQELKLRTRSKEGLNTEDVERAKALELASLELYHAARSQLQNDCHILLLPCLKLHLETCDFILQHVPNVLLSFGNRMSLLGRLVVSARRLIRLQTLVFGPDHFDLAQTLLDLGQAVEELLSRAPKRLPTIYTSVDTADDDGTPAPRTVSAFAALEHSSRQEHQRIKALYPHDAEAHIQNQITRIATS